MIEKQETEQRELQNPDILAEVLYGMGVFEIIAGVIIAIKLLPGEPPEEHIWLFIKYMPSLVWLFISILSGIFFFVFARILNYLKEISQNTSGKRT